MPAKNGSRCRFSGFARIRIAPTWATASVRIVGGIAATPSRARQIPLVLRHVLDADDALVRFQLDDPIDQQEGKTVRKNPFNRGVVERERQVHRREPIILWQGPTSRARPRLQQPRTNN